MSGFPLEISNGRLVRLAGFGMDREPLVMPLEPGERTIILDQLSKANQSDEAKKSGKIFSLNDQNVLCYENGSPIVKEDEAYILRNLRLD